jgi:transcription antitermination factor NusG
MNWYAYRVKSQKEKLAADILRDRFKMRSWCPYEKRFVRSRNKATEREYPLLIGYILVQSQAWWLPLSHHLVTSVVGFDGVPAIIPESAIDRLRKISGTHIPHASSVNMRTSFAPGDAVRITSGPLKGYETKVVSTKNRNVLLNLGLLGRDQTEIAMEFVEAA